MEHQARPPHVKSHLTLLLQWTRRLRQCSKSCTIGGAPLPSVVRRLRTPEAFCLSAQGCAVRATLGHLLVLESTLEGLWRSG
jgi:hypothetical protein